MPIRSIPPASLPPFPSIGKPEARKRVIFTIVECPSCRTKTKRAFQEGDYIAKQVESCDRCSASRRIVMIYAESALETRG